MNLIVGLTGIIITLIVIIDILQTTFFLNGAGFLSEKISFSSWKLLLKIHRRFNSHRFLSYTGGSLILVVFILWGILFLVGISFIYFSSEYSVINANTKAPADLWEKVYYIGFTVTTLGIGDFIAGSKMWQLITIVSAVTGFFLLTLLITYLISLLSSVKEKRAFASTINNIGSSPEQFLLQLRTRDDFSGLSNLLSSFIRDLNLITQNHLTYPALHYFHSSNKMSAIAPAIAILDEALSLLIVSYPDRYKEISILIDPTRDAISNLLATLKNSYIGAGDELPPIPHEKVIDGLSPKVVMREDVIKFYESIVERRKILLAYLKNNGWGWSDVVG